MWLVSVASNGLDGAFVNSLKAKRNLFRCLRLLVNVVVPALVITLEVLWAQMGAEVMVEALVIDVEPAGNVLRIAVVEFCHDQLERVVVVTASRVDDQNRLVKYARLSIPRVPS